ncbi:hypothetical protein CSA37_03110 [Candidatus Fermentibacteria bacterium]|nr:MAG: hypothetical protein CSA37_03110 [Candidatus Fermentibacteria bacterium]
MRGIPPRILLALLVISLAASLLFRFHQPSVVQEQKTFPVLGTFATVIITSEEENLPAMFHCADSLLRYLDRELGRFSYTGAVHDLNTENSASLDTELGHLILLSDTLFQATDGYFDPSLGLLVELWGFPEAGAVPDSSAIQEALQLTGWNRMVSVGIDSVYLQRGALLDFGAVAKGYAVDRTWELIMEMGAEECLVEAGGEIRCGSLTGRTWNVGVRHPREDSLAGIIAITQGAVATSGDYECFFIENGVRYSHLLNSSTGYPSIEAAGATVVADNCAAADGMATAAAVAGPIKAEGFSRELFQSMIIITEEYDGSCEVHEFGAVPWAE